MGQKRPNDPKLAVTIGVIQGALVLLKLLGVITWSWWWVLAPLVSFLAFIFFLLLIIWWYGR